MSKSKKQQAIAKAARLEERQALLKGFLILSDIVDPRSMAIMSAALVDGYLEMYLRSKLKNDSDDLHEAGGPLSGFSARSRMAYALGYINKDVKNDLWLIAQIRNKFAHSILEDLDFKKEVISGLVSQIRHRDHAVGNDPASIYRNACESIALQLMFEIDLDLRLRATRNAASEPAKTTERRSA